MNFAIFIINRFNIINMENIVVACSNFYAIFPIVANINKGYYFQACIISFSAISSFIYHLFEKNKHNMPGMSICRDDWYQILFINIDRLAAISAVIIYASNYHVLINYWYFLLLALFILLLSEYDRHKKFPYIPLHIIWHFSAFHLAWITI